MKRPVLGRCAGGAAHGAPITGTIYLNSTRACCLTRPRLRPPPGGQSAAFVSASLLMSADLVGPPDGQITALLSASLMGADLVGPPALAPGCTSCPVSSFVLLHGHESWLSA